MRHTKKIILGATGSIAVYKSLDLVRRLREQQGAEVFVVMTKEAQEFVRPLSFQALSANKVYTEMFQEPENWDVKHVGLAELADLVLICPATANIIAKLSCGICDDLLTSLVCATKAPVLIAPAMNDNMYNNKIVQGNIARLKSLGFKFIGPKFGRLASGKKGIGRLEDVDTIIREVKKFLR